MVRLLVFPLPCSLKGPGTHSWIPGPGETPPREDPPDPTDKPHHFTYGPSSPRCPSIRQGSQLHSESEVVEEERSVPSQHLVSSLLLVWPRP